MPRLPAALFLLSLATACVPASLAAQNTDGAVPGSLFGSLNFVQGQVNIDGQPLHGEVAAPQPRQLRPGETLATTNGSADILLAPGALLRIGADTTVHMVAADAGRTEVRLDQGLANVSVNVVRREHLLLLDTANSQTQVLSRGLYTLNMATNTLRVFHGEADVFPGANSLTNVKAVKVKEGRELLLDGERAKPDGFDRELAGSDLLPWTGPRESQAALKGDGTIHHAAYNGYSGYGAYGGGLYPGAYGFYGPYAYSAPSFAYDGFGYPYGPYGFGGYPFFGVGFGFYGGGFYRPYGYRPGFPVRGPGRFGSGGVRGGFAPHAFAGGGHAIGGGGFGGFHGGGGHR